MQISAAEKQAFVNALDQAKKTIHPNIVICTRRYRSQTYWTFRHILIQQCGDVHFMFRPSVMLYIYMDVMLYIYMIPSPGHLFLAHTHY